MKRLAIAFTAIAAWFVPLTGRAEDPLERVLVKSATDMIKLFQKEGYKNVGVLKFLVSRDGKGFTDNVGTLNLLAARRLERALLAKNDARSPVGIIDNASEIAGKIAGASHLSAEGREKLFAEQYSLAWGTEKVRPDAFVTGSIGISKDLRTMTMTLYRFDRTMNKLVAIGDDLKVANSIDLLAEMGESFMCRDAFGGGNVEISADKIEEKTYQEAVKVREQEVKHPGQQDAQPVTLEVFYDKKKVPIEFRQGKAFIPEPREGQSVHFGISRDKSKERFGVVLKVNGENTLEKERLPDISCQKWVLDPGNGPWTIEGFHVGNTRERFRVASIAESKAREVYYGHDVGTITMTVFREKKGRAKPKVLHEDEQYETAVKKLYDLPMRPMNYQALKAQLLEDANRGLIVAGQREPSKLETVSFTADPNPVGCWTIVYYRK